MNFCVDADKDGNYTLKVLTDMFNNVGMRRWVPLRRFYLQGDAFLFRDVYAPKLEEHQIKMMHACYDPNKLYGMTRNHNWAVVRRADEQEESHN
jgi:hypothetical protein